MSEPFIGEIKMVGYNFAPRAWASCNGQLLSIAQNTALFSLLGTTYGGNGQTTFALPDLRSRVPVGAGQGPGLSNYTLGQMRGTESHTLSSNEIPAHTHTVNANSGIGTENDPNAHFLSSAPLGLGNVYSTAANTTMPSDTVRSPGSQPHANLMPYQAVNYVICLEGVFPSRN